MTKIRTNHEVTRKSTFSANPFRGELLLEPGKRPQVIVERTSHSPGINRTIKETMDFLEIEVLIAILEAIADELRPTAAPEPGES